MVAGCVMTVTAPAWSETTPGLWVRGEFGVGYGAGTYALLTENVATGAPARFHPELAGVDLGVSGLLGKRVSEWVGLGVKGELGVLLPKRNRFANAEVSGAGRFGAQLVAGLRPTSAPVIVTLGGGAAIMMPAGAVDETAERVYVESPFEELSGPTGHVGVSYRWGPAGGALIDFNPMWLTSDSSTFYHWRIHIGLMLDTWG